MTCLRAARNVCVSITGQVFLMLLVVGPALSQKAPAADSPGDLRARIQELEKDIAALRKGHLDSFERITKLESDSASFDVTSPNKFLSVASSVGPILISFKGATRYLNGYRAAFEIGNPHLAKITGYEITATWSAAFKDDKDTDFLKWFNAKKSKTVRSSVPIVPGMWTKIWIILPNTSASEFEELDIRLDVSRVEMPIAPESPSAVQ